MENWTALPATLVVDTLVDESDSNLAAGDVSLREALAAVGAGGTITFAEALASQDVGFGLGVLGLTLGELVVDKSLTIEGLGADALTISGLGQSRVFWLDDGDRTTSSDITMTGLAITNGVGEQAGGILTVGENLTFEQGYLAENTGGIATALSATGEGEIADILIKSSLLFANQEVALSTQGKLQLTDSRIINTAGVGIRHMGELTLQNSGVSDSQGRGIVSTGTLQLFSSQVESNIGDGIRHTGDLIATNASISNNQGDGVISVGDFQLTNSQIVENALSGVVINDTMTLAESSISSNGAVGIAAFTDNSDARIFVTDSFISENTAGNFDSSVCVFINAVPAVEPVSPAPDEPRGKIGGTKESDRIQGSAESDVIRAWGGDDRIQGGSGNDYIEGGSGDDHIFGGGGEDVLGGGRGHDRLSGGLGRDRFVYSKLSDGNDIIVDFQIGEDVIDLSALFSDERYSSARPFEDYVRIGETSHGTQISVGDISRSQPDRIVYQEIVLLSDVRADGIDASSFLL